MWALAVAVAATMVAFLGFALWQSRLLTAGSRRCPVCGGEREVVTPPGRHRTFEVAACPHCADVETTVQGQPSRFAICPACSQFGLELEATAVGPSEVGLVPPVEVDEHCRICGFHDDWTVPEVADDLPNNVIEFPRR